MRALAVFAMITLSVHGATLDDLLATAAKLRKLDKKTEQPADQITFKHQLRDWIESRLPLGVSGEQLMSELTHAGLEAPEDIWESASAFGYIAEIEITHPAEYPALLRSRPASVWNAGPTNPGTCTCCQWAAGGESSNTNGTSRRLPLN
jgi:hypothetical protein